MNCYTRLFAVVTGPSSGIGHELAKQLEESGYDLLNDGVETLFETIRISDRPLEAIAINAGVDVGGDFTRRTALIRS